jgi:hypothetical protein
MDNLFNCCLLLCVSKSFEHTLVIDAESNFREFLWFASFLNERSSNKFNIFRLKFTGLILLDFRHYCSFFLEIRFKRIRERVFDFNYSRLNVSGIKSEKIKHLRGLPQGSSL